MLDKFLLRLYIWLDDTKRLITSILGNKQASAQIPKRILDELARCFLPDIIAFHESPEDRAEYEEWEACPNATTASERPTEPLKAKIRGGHPSVLPGMLRQK